MYAVIVCIETGASITAELQGICSYYVISNFSGYLRLLNSTVKPSSWDILMRGHPVIRRQFLRVITPGVVSSPC